MSDILYAYMTSVDFEQFFEYNAIVCNSKFSFEKTICNSLISKWSILFLL